MTPKEKLILTISLIASLTVIIVVVILKSSPFPGKTNTQATNAASDDPMHQQQAVNSGVFDGLVGKPAPDFAIASYDGKQVSLKDYRGKNVLLFFNEGLMCYPACWNQIAAFGKDTSFQQKNTVVLTITVNTKDEWKEAIGKMPELAGNTVLLDTDRKLSTMYGVLSLDSSMHRGELPGHTYILIDAKGVVRYTRDDAEMAVRNTELLTEISKL